jgi:hypothetical protein
VPASPAGTPGSNGPNTDRRHAASPRLFRSVKTAGHEYPPLGFQLIIVAAAFRRPAWPRRSAPRPMGEVARSQQGDQVATGTPWLSRITCHDCQGHYGEQQPSKQRENDLFPQPLHVGVNRTRPWSDPPERRDDDQATGRALARWSGRQARQRGAGTSSRRPYFGWACWSRRR